MSTVLWGKWCRLSVFVQYVREFTSKLTVLDFCSPPVFYYTVYINASQSWCQIKTVSLDFGGLLNNLSIHRELTHSPRAGISPIYFIKMFSYSRIKKTGLRAEKSDSRWLWDPPGINLGGHRWLGSCTIRQRLPTPQPWSMVCQKSSRIAGGEWQVSEQSVICISSCSPSLASPPELRCLSDRQ